MQDIQKRIPHNSIINITQYISQPKAAAEACINALEGRKLIFLFIMQVYTQTKGLIPSNIA